MVAGKGVIAHADGHEVVVGNRALLDDRDIDIPGRVADYVREREERGETVVHVIRDGDIIGAIALRDELRESAPGVVAALQDAGIETVMLTGDNERTAAVASDRRRRGRPRLPARHLSGHRVRTRALRHPRSTFREHLTAVESKVLKDIL